MSRRVPLHVHKSKANIDSPTTQKTVECKFDYPHVPEDAVANTQVKGEFVFADHTKKPSNVNSTIPMSWGVPLQVLKSRRIYIRRPHKKTVECKFDYPHVPEGAVARTQVKGEFVFADRTKNRRM